MQPTLASVHNALEILHLLRQRGPMRLSDIADELGVSISTTHRLVSTLRAQRFVRQEADGRRYELGSAMLFSTEVTALDHCVAVSESVMKQLQETSGETVHLSVLRGATCLFAASYESQHPARVTSRVGRGPLAHTAAGGKVLLAALDRDRLYELLPNDHLDRATERSLPHRNDLLRELEQTREQGFARNIGESEHNMYAIAVPVHRPNGEVISSLTIAAPLSRIVNADDAAALTPYEESLLHELQQAAVQIESLLAF